MTDASPASTGPLGLRIEAPHFVCGVELRNNVVVRAAPIVKYMVGWTSHKVYDYCAKRRWELKNSS